MEREPFTYHKSTYNAYDAQQIVFEAIKYKSELTIQDGNKRANAKSIVGLLTVRFAAGDEYVVFAEGADARRAAAGLASFIAGLR